jgi:KUP system potassium uptake protein
MGHVFGDIGTIFAHSGIDEKTILYGMEEIITTQPVKRILAAVKRLCPSVVQFCKLPPDKIHGIVTRIEVKVLRMLFLIENTKNER